MSDDPLLKALGNRAREEDDLPIPSELLTPLDANARGRIAERLVSKLPAAEPWWQRWFRPVLVPVTLAASVAVALVVLRQDSSPLPSYSMQVSGGVQTFRGAAEEKGPEGRLTLREGSQLQLVFQPAVPFEGEVALSLFVVGQGPPLSLQPTVQRSSQGALKAEIVPADLRPLPAGEYELLAVLSPPGARPSSADEVTTRSRQDWQVFRHRLQWE